ncbi:competence protein ComJ, partial [Planococcus sp. SIMBA_160]
SGKHIEKEEVIRTVTVPFTVKNECIVVTSILSNKFQIPIPNGEYTVVLQATPLYLLQFIRNCVPKDRF